MVNTLASIAFWIAAVSVLVWLFWYLRRERRSHERCARELPLLAEKLGLVFEQDRLFAKIGVISGICRDHRVRICPDDDVKITVSSRGSLSSEGREVYIESRPLLDVVFHTPQLRARWRKKLRVLELAKSYEGFTIQCSPKRGTPDSGTSGMPKYVLPEDVEELLPLLLRAARELETEDDICPR